MMTQIAKSLLVGALVVGCQRPAPSESTPPPTPPAGTPATATKCTCPMHAKAASDQGARCPHCGMNLAESHAGHAM